MFHPTIICSFTFLREALITTILVSHKSMLENKDTYFIISRARRSNVRILLFRCFILQIFVCSHFSEKPLFRPYLCYINQCWRILRYLSGKKSLPVQIEFLHIFDLMMHCCLSAMFVDGPIQKFIIFFSSHTMRVTSVCSR